MNRVVLRPGRPTAARGNGKTKSWWLEDRRLCVTYGYRATPYGIRAKINSDNGQTWGEEIGLRLDGRNFDLGYTRSVVRPDGKIVTIYYHTAEQMPEQRIAATIWEPDAVTRRVATQ